ncbi:hypothetical protein SELR_pSRC102120 (plasmid) [Selenomonas ruminantium subsp. lactilytica TAM6421]|uniref:Uncharacterized protein n=1 Tax=Selenomonas ruminantium subsp. lactilytica (strain NBRC 103574 / TAM6421) TaxID=927704 RepID=I0GW82_SELRL|nr:DUF188 domain-containing protein [Selenomonas ruminantium]BAL85019.1 hypothetical protein SELR_pSRC102120 [Selenomonas ruminantium subsp. lactilytica TAM6421]
MRIFVDADACPVVRQTEEVAKEYSVPAMALGKRAYAMHQNGWQYTNENIERLLMERHLAKKARRASGKHHLKGPRKRSEEDNLQFKNKLERLLIKLLEQVNT